MSDCVNQDIVRSSQYQYEPMLNNINDVDNVDAMASKNKGGRGKVHYTGKRKCKYVHYIRYIIRKCLRLNLHITIC